MVIDGTFMILVLAAVMKAREAATDNRSPVVETTLTVTGFLLVPVDRHPGGSMSKNHPDKAGKT